MLLAKIIRASFSQMKAPETITIMNEMILERRASRQKLATEFKNNKEIVPIQLYVKEHKVDLTLYIKSDHAPSLYTYAILNYYQMGFIRVSDLSLLDRASYFLNMRKIQEAQRWPSMKVEIGIEDKEVLVGGDKIQSWLAKNKYMDKKIEKGTAEINALQKHINQRILPPLQALFWHPTLTYQYAFRTYFDNSSQISQNQIYFTLRKNLSTVLSKIFRNLSNIFKNKQLYFSAKSTLSSQLQEVARMYFKDGGFFGGLKPNHADFYLLSHIQTKMGSYHFRKYLQEDLKGDFWRWFLRMKQLCQYNSDRVTLL